MSRMHEDEKDEEYEEYERYVDKYVDKSSKYVDNSRWLILENVPEYDIELICRELAA